MVSNTSLSVQHVYHSVLIPFHFESIGKFFQFKFGEAWAQFEYALPEAALIWQDFQLETENPYLMPDNLLTYTIKKKCTCGAPEGRSSK